jgi:hypothetical protein
VEVKSWQSSYRCIDDPFTVNLQHVEFGPLSRRRLQSWLDPCSLLVLLPNAKSQLGHSNLTCYSLACLDTLAHSIPLDPGASSSAPIAISQWTPAIIPLRPNRLQPACRSTHCWRQWLFLLETAYCKQVSRLFPKFFLGTAYATG